MQFSHEIVNSVLITYIKQSSDPIYSQMLQRFFVNINYSQKISKIIIVFQPNKNFDDSTVNFLLPLYEILTQKKFNFTLTLTA